MTSKIGTLCFFPLSRFKAKKLLTQNLFPRILQKNPCCEMSLRFQYVILAICEATPPFFRWCVQCRAEAYTENISGNHGIRNPCSHSPDTDSTTKLLCHIWRDFGQQVDDRCGFRVTDLESFLERSGTVPVLAVT